MNKQFEKQVEMQKLMVIFHNTSLLRTTREGNVFRRVVSLCLQGMKVR